MGDPSDGVFRTQSNRKSDQFFLLKSKYKKASMLKSSWPFAIGRFAPAYQSGDVVLMGLIMPADVTGTYAAASRLAATLNFP